LANPDCKEEDDHIPEEKETDEKKDEKKDKKKIGRK